MDGFNVVVPIEVTFRDTDAMRHANNAVYLTWFENGRIGYWRAMTEPHGESADYAAVPFVLARAEIDFRAPAFVGDRLELGVRLSRLGSRSFDFDYRLVRPADGTVLAVGSTVQVMYDYRQGSSIDMPTEFRARLVEIDGEPGGEPD
jgi:acyl-CoA thioester hydrolase